jgi:uncharacterized membrane protein
MNLQDALPARLKDWDDHRLEMILGALLRTGVALAAAVVAIGAVVYLARHAHEVAGYGIFHGQPDSLKSLSAIAQAALGGSGSAIIQLGLLLLIATPIARVLFSAVAFVMERDYLYVFTTAIVLAVLLYSLFGSA